MKNEYIYILRKLYIALWCKNRIIKKTSNNWINLTLLLSRFVQSLRSLRTNRANVRNAGYPNVGRTLRARIN